MKSLKLIKSLVPLLFILCMAGRPASAAPFTITVTYDSITCYGADDATAYISEINGGVGPFTFTWWTGGGVQLPETDSIITDLSPGNYRALVYDNEGDFAAYDFSIWEPTTIQILAVSKTDVLCNGDSSGTINIIAFGGTIPRKYSIDGGGTYHAGSFFSDQPAGIYNIVVSDKNNCATVYSGNPVTISEPAALSITNPSITHITCAGYDDGAISVDVGGGTLPYTYIWRYLGSDFAYVEDISDLAPGDYYLEVTDGNGCTANIGPLTVSEPPPLLITQDSVNMVTCNGDADGEIWMSVSGGTPVYNYSWTSDLGYMATTEDITGLAPDTYYLYAEDANGCNTTTPGIIITEPPVLTAGLDSIRQISCFGIADGAIYVSVAGGTPPYSYDWTGTGGFSGSSQDITGLSQQDYDLLVTDANGCTVALGPFSIIEPTEISISTVSVDNLTCFESSDGAIDVDVSGGTPGYTYLWSGPPPFSDTTQDISGLAAGDYDLQVWDANGCLKVHPTISVTEPPPLVITQDSVFNVLCNGDADGRIYVTVTGGTPGYTYNWTSDLGFPPAATEDITGLAPDTYYLYAEDANGCNTTTPGIIITEPPVLTAGLDSIRQISCFGIADGAIYVSVAGGTPPYSYDWTGTGGFSGSSQDITGLSQQDYDLLVTDANGCTFALGPYSITEPTEISISTVSVDNLTCFESSDGAIDVDVSGGTPGYTYLWSGPPPFSDTTQDIGGLAAGDYDLQVWDVNGCLKVHPTITVTEPPPLVITQDSVFNVLCNGDADGRIYVTVTGGTPGYTYNWTSDLGFPPAATEDITGLGPDTYYLYAEDANGCNNTTPGIIITEPPAISILSVDSAGITCTGADDAYIDISASGGTGLLTYILRNPAPMDTNNTGLFTGLPPDTYRVRVYDENGCGPEISDPLTFIDPGPVMVTVEPSSVKTLDCYGDSTGSLDISVTGGWAPYTYAWTGPPGYSSSAKNIAGLKAGVYSLTVTDAKGCTGIYDPLDNITGPTQLQMSITKVDVTCFGAADDTAWVFASGGTPPYLYDDGFGPYASNVFVGLGPGTHTLEVIDDNSCTVSDTVTILTPQELEIVGENVVDSMQKCNGDSNGIIVITAMGGTGLIEYSIDSGYTFSPNNTFTGLGGGTYYSAVRDQNGCIAYKSALLISNPPDIYISQYTQDNILSCSYLPEGEVRIRAKGGTPIPGLNPYIYVMDLADTSLTGVFPGLAAGNHTIDIYDKNACTIDTTIEITSPPPILFSTIITHVTTCYEDSTGSVGIIAKGGTGLTKGYVFGADTTFSTDTVFYDSLPGGSYDFTVFDSLGCEVFPSAVINAPDSISADSVRVFPVTCSGDTDGEIRVYATGGTAPYTYVLNPGADTSYTGIYTGLSPGDYTLSIHDAPDCKPYLTPLLTILEPPVLLYDTTVVTTISCGGFSDGIISMHASGGLPPYAYSLNDGADYGADSVAGGLGPGTYIIHVMDYSGCSVAGDTITLTDPPGLSLDPSVVTDVALCAGDSTGAISVSASGGTGALEYSLDSMNWQASGDFTGLPAGIYTAVVRDSRSCLLEFPPDTILEPPVITATITTTTAMIPDPGTIIISATGGTPPLEYSIDSGASFSADTIYFVPSDIYWIVIRDANGCTHEESVYVTATPPLEVSVSYTGIDCYGNDNGSISLIQLNGIGTVSYSIDGGGSFQSTGEFTGLPGASYYIHVADSHRIFRDTVDIINPPPFDVTGTITPASCSRNSFDGAVSLIVSGATPPYTYLWSNDSTSQDISGLEGRNYTVTITDLNGCLYTETYEVVALVDLIADAGPDTVVCYGSVINLNGSGGDEFTWSPEEGLSRIDIPDPTTTVTDTVYYVLFTRDQASGCSDRDTVMLTVHPDRGISAGQDTTVAPGQYITLTATGGLFVSYLWQPSEGLDNPAAQSTTATISGEITYWVTGITEFGCPESDSMNIFIATGLRIYSGFTPNDDGVNDFWDIDDILYYPNATVKVFDRWGRVVFSSVGYADDQRWDGKYKGKDLPIGTYYYIIDLKDGSPPYKGPVTIVR